MANGGSPCGGELLAGGGEKKRQQRGENHGEKKLGGRKTQALGRVRGRNLKIEYPTP